MSPTSSFWSRIAADRNRDALRASRRAPVGDLRKGLGKRIGHFLSLALLVIAAASFLCGCGGYRLGPTGGQIAGEKSVQVLPFVNHSSEPGLSDEVTSALRKSIQRDGTFHLATQGGGDWVVSGILIGYSRQEETLSSSDIRTVIDYRVTLTAKITVRDRASGRVLLERDVSGVTLERVGQDFVSTERQSAPLLADSLAKQITDLLVDGEW
jgi:hypothetical protein